MLENAIDRARKDLLSIGIDRIVKNTGAVSEKEGAITVKYFNTIFEIVLPDFIFEPDLPDFEKTLMLHYLTGGDVSFIIANSDSKKKYVSYANLKDGMFYFKTFQRRGPEKIRKAFSEKPELLIEAAQSCGGVRESYSDISVIIPVFPRLSVIVVLTLSDEEFPSSVNMLFPSDATIYLPLEDLALTGDVVAKKLCSYPDIKSA